MGLWSYAFNCDEPLFDITTGMPTKSRHQPKKLQRGFVDPGEEFLFTAPSTACFGQFQQRLVRSLKADNLLRKGFVTNVSHEPTGGSAAGCMRVELLDGACILAQHVVLAVGGALSPRIPPAFSTWFEDWPSDRAKTGKIVHSSDTSALASVLNKSSIQATTLVVGGGLTAAHVVMDLARRHTPTIWVTRAQLRVQPFDLEFSWFSRFSKSAKLFDFYQCDMSTRACFLQEVHRGSIPPAMFENIRALLAQGLLTLTEDVHVLSVDNAESGRLKAILSNGVHVQCEQVVLCTGTQVTLDKLPMMQSLRQQRPIPELNGLPCLQPNLQWSENVPLFIMGPLAGLTLGPFARNLAGARLGTDFIIEAMPDPDQHNAKLKRSSAKKARRRQQQNTETPILRHPAGAMPLFNNRYATLDM